MATGMSELWGESDLSRCLSYLCLFDPFRIRRAAIHDHGIRVQGYCCRLVCA